MLKREEGGGGEGHVKKMLGDFEEGGGGKERG